jgi:hypothetical protein
VQVVVVGLVFEVCARSESERAPAAAAAAAAAGAFKYRYTLWHAHTFYVCTKVTRSDTSIGKPSRRVFRLRLFCEDPASRFQH